MRSARLKLALLPTLLVLAAVSPASPQGVVKIPIVAEITGGGASVGAMWRDAVNLAVEDINKKGGVLGMKLETSVQDTQTDPPTSVAVMRRVLNDKPFAVFGTVYSSSTVANMDIAKQAGVPQFTGSESIIITQKGNDNIFLTSFTQDTGMAKMVRWLLDDLKAEKIALVWVNNAFGKGGHDMFVQFLKERGIQTSIHYPPIHQFTYYRSYTTPAVLPVTEQLGRRLVTLPLYPHITLQQIDAVVEAVTTWHSQHVSGGEVSL